MFNSPKALTVALCTALLMAPALIISTQEASLADRLSLPNRRSHRNIGQPRSSTTAAGGTRSVTTSSTFCGQTLDGANLTPLIPTDSVVYTTNPEPLLLVYVPPLPEGSPGNASLTVKLQDGETQATSRLNVPTQGGLVAFPMPDAVLPLQNNSAYEWALQISCETTPNLNDPPILEGWLAYQASPNGETPTPNLDPQNPRAVPLALQEVDEFEDAGFWVDALMRLTPLLQLQGTNIFRTDVVPRLESLLEDEDLKALAPYFLN